MAKRTTYYSDGFGSGSFIVPMPDSGRAGPPPPPAHPQTQTHPDFERSPASTRQHRYSDLVELGDYHHASARAGPDDSRRSSMFEHHSQEHPSYASSGGPAPPPSAQYMQQRSLQPVPAGARVGRPPASAYLGPGHAEGAGAGQGQTGLSRSRSIGASPSHSARRPPIGSQDYGMAYSPGGRGGDGRAAARLEPTLGSQQARYAAPTSPASRAMPPPPLPGMSESMRRGGSWDAPGGPMSNSMGGGAPVHHRPASSSNSMMNTYLESPGASSGSMGNAGASSQMARGGSLGLIRDWADSSTRPISSGSSNPGSTAGLLNSSHSNTRPPTLERQDTYSPSRYAAQFSNVLPPPLANLAGSTSSAYYSQHSMPAREESPYPQSSTPSHHPQAQPYYQSQRYFDSKLNISNNPPGHSSSSSVSTPRSPAMPMSSHNSGSGSSDLLRRGSRRAGTRSGKGLRRVSGVGDIEFIVNVQPVGRRGDPSGGFLSVRSFYHDSCCDICADALL